MSDADVSPSLRGWSVVCLRPHEDQATAARVIAARGAVPIALPGLRLAPAEDAEQARTQLRRAFACDAVVFTSPAAVRFAAMLVPLTQASGREVFAVGAGTARALASLGIQARHPDADTMHSEGLLALPAFAGRRGSVGLVTAPGGRGVLLRTLSERGPVSVAHVYRRLPPHIDIGDLEVLLASRAPRAVLVTSAEALRFIIEFLPAPVRLRLLDAVAVTSSARLAEAARDAGFAAVLQAPSPEPGRLLDTLAQHHVTSPRLPAT